MIPICPIRTPANSVAVTDPRPNAFERKFAEVVPEGEREEDGDFRVLPEGRSQPCHYEHHRSP